MRDGKYPILSYIVSEFNKRDPVPYILEGQHKFDCAIWNGQARTYNNTFLKCGYRGPLLELYTDEDVIEERELDRAERESADIEALGIELPDKNVDLLV